MKDNETAVKTRKKLESIIKTENLDDNIFKVIISIKETIQILREELSTKLIEEKSLRLQF
ncbi:MAG: hypothetical protein ACW972_03700 [Promethearchaeota archaeon]|jgi:hypothetical protein